MATIAKLVLQIEAETRSLRQTFGGATRLVNTFARDMERSFARIPTLASITGPGGDLLRQRLGGVRTELNNTIKDLRAALKGKFIDREEFGNEMVTAIRAARTKSRSAIRELEGFGLLDKQQADTAVRAANAASKKAEQALVGGSRTVQQAQRVVDRLERQFQAREVSNVISRATGGFASAKAFEVAGRENAAKHNVALAAEMEKFAASGRLTEPLRRALTSKFKAQGFGFGEAMSPNEQSISRATRAVDVLQRRMERRVASARFDLANKAISPEAFERRAFQAGQAFDRGLLGVIGKMRGTNTLSDEADRFLTRKFKTIGKKNADEGVFAAKEYVANFRDTYNRAIQSARFASLSGDLTTRQFKGATRDAAQELAAGLKQVSARLESEGLLTPAAVKFLNTQFAEAGGLAGKTFLERFHSAQADDTGKGLSALSQGLSAAGSTLTKALTLPLAAAGAASLKLAADSEQAGKRLEISFGPASVQLERNLNALRSTIPATSAELKGMASRLGELIIPLGLSSDAVAKMSLDLIKVTKNISLFAGVSTERAFNAVINGLVGQSRELKKLGVEIDDKTIRDRAYREGLTRVGAQLTTTQKVHAGYLVIMERSRIIENTLAQSQGTLNVQLLFFVARLKEAGIAIGTVLLPVATRMIVALTSIVERFGAIDAEQRKWVIGIAILVATLGPLLILLGKLVSAFAIYRAAVLAATAATAVSGAAGVAAGGALGIGGIAVAAGAAIPVILALAAALGLYLLATKDAGTETARFMQEISGMSKEGLKQTATGLVEAERVIRSRMISLQAATGVKRLAPDPMVPAEASSGLGRLVGGTAEARAEFESLEKTLQRFRNEQGLVGKEIDALVAKEKEVAKFAEAYAARIEAVHAMVAKDLLVEVLARAKNDLSNLTAAATAATREINTGLRIKDDKLFGAGLERAKNALEGVTALVRSLRDQQVMPENANIAKSLGRTADLAEGLRARLQGLVETSEKSSVFKVLADRLGNVRAALALGSKTGDLTALTRGFAQAATLSDDLARMIEEKREQGDQATAERLQRVMDQLQTLIVTASRFSPTEFIKSVDETIEKIKLLRSEAGEGVITSTGIPLQDFARADELVQDLLDDEQVLLALIKKQGEAGLPTLDLLRAHRRLLKEIQDATPNLFETMFGANFLPRVQQVADAIKNATGIEDAAKLGASVEAQQEAALGVVAARAQLGLLLAELQTAIAGAKLDPTQAAAVLKGFTESFKKASGGAVELGENVDGMSKRLLRMTAVVRVLREMAELFGVTNENILKAIRSAGTLVDSLQNLRTVNAQSSQRRREQDARNTVSNPFAMPTGMNASEIAAQLTAVAGIISSAVNIVSGVFAAFRGQSEAETARRAVLDENNRRLGELASALEGFSLSIGNQLKASAALADPKVQKAALGLGFAQSDKTAGPGIRGFFTRELEAQLARFGVTMGDINRIAAEHGIKILDDKGRLVAEAFLQLIKAIELAREHFFDYAETLSDAQTKTSLFNDVFNVEPTGQQEVLDNLAFLEDLAPALFEKFFAGVDLSDATAVEAAVQAMTNALLTGALEADGTLKLLDRGELEQIILGVAGGLDKLREATDDMTESMLNVPEWFRTNQVRFESVDPIVPTEHIPQTKPDTSIDANPKPPSGVRPVGEGAIAGRDVVINITQQPGESSEELARRVVAQLRSEKFMRTGSTRLPGIDDDVTGN